MRTPTPWSRPSTALFRATVVGGLEERLAMAPARRLRLAVAEEAVSRHAGDRPLRVLDAGCGDGLLSLALAERHPDWLLLGVDTRGDMLEGARARAQARKLTNVRFECADVTRNLPGGEFDVALVIECLSEIPDDERALRAIGAALAPGGLLVAHVPEQSWRAILPGSPSTWREQVRQGYSADEIAGALQRAGLQPVEVRPTYRALAMVAQEMRDRLKDSRLAVRLATFPVLAGGIRLERWGLTGGRANALLAVARRPSAI